MTAATAIASWACTSNPAGGDASLTGDAESGADSSQGESSSPQRTPGDSTSLASGDPEEAAHDAKAVRDAPDATLIDAGLDAPDSDSDVVGVPLGPLSPGYVDFDVNHILMTGQSNAVANGGDPPLTANQPSTNLMFNTGVMPMTSCDGNGCKSYENPSSFVPLIQNDKFFGYSVETAANGLADEISLLAGQNFEFGAHAGYPAKHDIFASQHGRSGNTYWCLRKGFCTYNLARGHLSPFAQAMKEVESAKSLAAAAGKSYVVRAVVAIHGESDHYAYVAGAQEFPLPGTDGTPDKITNYEDGLVEWQEDYESSVKAATGQTLAVPLLISGLSGFTTTRTSQILNWQLNAHIRTSGKVVYVTPAYPLSIRGDCLHFDNHGQRRLGEYFAKAYARIVLAGQRWEPVRPKSIARAGNVVTVDYYVPSPPLTFDTVHVTNPGNYGFDFSDNGALVEISSVVLLVPSSVRITLANVPSGLNMHLLYAQNQNTDVASRCIGPGLTHAGGARGNLRDSDNTPSRYGYDLWNWGANFDVSIQ